MGISSRLFGSRGDTSTLRRWAKRTVAAPSEDRTQLREQIDSARMLQSQMHEFLRVAEDRVAVPKIGADAFREGRGTEWSWRADAWRWRSDTPGFAAVQNGDEIAPSLRLFHDCHISEITTRQIRNKRQEDVAPFGIAIDVMNFDGSFMSVVLDLPPDSTLGLRKNHLIRLNTMVDVERPMEIYARLNIKHGPNTEQLVRGLSWAELDSFVEFDMALADLNEKRIEQMWLDIIFDNPKMNRIVLREFSLSRKPRSDF